MTNSGTSSAAILDFTIPRGNTGANGSGGESNGITLAPIAYNAYGDSITACAFSPGITCYVNRIAAALYAQAVTEDKREAQNTLSALITGQTIPPMQGAEIGASA